MWTPKRVLILVGGMGFFLTLYLGYTFALGGINGLLPLPEEYLPDGQVHAPIAHPADADDSDRKIRIAFGAECAELRRPIRLDLRSKGIVIAASQFEIEQPDGRVKLSPFSAALFPKDKPDAQYPEVNTVQCEVAYLTLDRPAKNSIELGSRRIIGVELRGGGSTGITIVNNRRSPETNDDITLTITNGPLLYEESRQVIWTDGVVKLLDTSSRPDPILITAEGMELQLTKDSDKSKTGSGKNHADAINGVDILTLRRNVDMHLYVDTQSGFLAGPEEAAKKPAPPRGKANAPAEKSHLVLHTYGSFTYYLKQERAVFDAPPLQDGVVPEQVQVSRVHPQTDNKKLDKVDQLLCDHLELQFRRKGQVNKSLPGGSRATDKEIESALATARSGRLVELDMSETENLKAFGQELLYLCPTPTQGAQTILKGAPLQALKDSHRIEARELHLLSADKKGQGQRVFAKGPGQIDICDKTKGDVKNPHYPIHINWQDSLISAKDVQGDKTFDLLTLTVDATFIDEDHHQELQAQRLQVWLDQTNPGAGPPAPSNAPLGSKQRISKIDAYERVAARSPEMIIRKTNHLVVLFRDEVPPEFLLPETSSTSAAPPIAGPGEVLPPSAVAPPPVASTAPGKPATATKPMPPVTPAVPAGTATEPAQKPRKPIELQANEVVAYVFRIGPKNQLKELVTEGAVHVTQEASDPKDKGVDIKGEMLNLIHHPQGDLLHVFGDNRTKPAQLQLGDLVLIGPKVSINQKENMAEVEGAGAMHMPSNTSFDGGKPAKPGTRLVVYWNKNMLFNGKYADFHGGIEAHQENSKLKCQNMQVVLDRAVSFKEGQKGGGNAKVEKLVCDRKIYVLDEARDDKGNFLHYHRLEASQLIMDNQQGPVIAAGPGRVTILSYGNADPNLGGKQPAVAGPAQPAKQELKRTLIDFEGRMFSNSKDNTRNAKFYDNVEVYHDPANHPDAPINPSKPPKNGFYLRCDLLTVHTAKLADNKSSQVMHAKGKVTFRTEEFFGNADSVKFDEAQDTIVFEGGPEGMATLYRQRGGVGTPPQQIKGRKILYNRKTGVFHLDGGNVISSWNLQIVPEAPALRNRWQRA